MDIFGEARRAFSKAADGVSRGAEALRLESDIAEMGKLVTDNWAAVGRRTLVLYKLGRVGDPEVQTLLKTAEASEEKLQRLQLALQALRRGERVRRCPGCGEAITELTEFCGKCGAKLPVCRQCLEPLSAEDTACPSCGAAVGSGEAP